MPTALLYHHARCSYYQWMVRSAAYAANEWATATPWNTPSSLLLPAGGKAVYSWRLFTAPSQDEVEATLIKVRAVL